MRGRNQSMARGGRTSVAAATAIALLLGSAVSPNGGTAAGADRTTSPRGTTRSTANTVIIRTPRILVEPLLGRPDGVAVGVDGSVYATDPTAGRIAVQRPGGGIEHPIVPDVTAPSGIAVTDDGTLFVGGGPHLVRVAPDGAQTVLAVPGLRNAADLDADAAGNVYVTDPDTDQVHRVAPDGTVDELAFTGLTDIGGIDAADDGTVSVLDLTAKDVVRRAPDGTQTAVGFLGLTDPQELDVEGDRIAVSQVPNVLVRDGDGTTGSPIIVGGLAAPAGVVLSADGTIHVADGPDDDCRCPAQPGAVHRIPTSGDPGLIRFGDVAAFGSVAATAPGTVLFTSWTGPRGYSDANPLRQVVGSGTPTDVTTPGAEGAGVDAAPDGTIYRADDHSVTRFGLDGAATTVALPSEPGLDAVVDISVDESGRLFVAMGSGYGTGAYLIVEPLAAGGSTTWFRGDGSAEQFRAMAAGAGGVVLVTTGTMSGTVHLWDLDGTGRTERPSPALQNVDAVEVDLSGVAYVVSYPASTARIDVVARDGSSSTLAYDGIGHPRDLSIGTDGTLYVGDDDRGLLALDDVGATPEVTPTTPGEAPPAAPVDGTSSFTG